MVKYLWLHCVTLLCAERTAALSPNSERIVKQAAADGIDILALPYGSAALTSIDTILVPVNFTTPTNSTSAPRIDTHVHAVPDWYRALVPITGQGPTPAWDITTHLQFAANNSITHSVLSISTPGSVVFPGNETLSVGLARLLNEWLAALVKTYPDKFSFYAVMPLPYTTAAIREASYALNTLKATGLGLLTNHEGYYLGNPILKPFFAALDATNYTSAQKVIFLHPTDPLMRLNSSSSLIVANPTTYPDGLVEFYFETARTFMDLFLSSTLTNFTTLRWAGSHVGGSFPSILDRMEAGSVGLKSQEAVLRGRVWWDSAGPTYPRQVQGLLAYGIPTSQLIFGTDYPYGRYPAAAAIVDLLNTSFLTSAEKQGVFAGNAEVLYGGCSC